MGDDPTPEEEVALAERALAQGDLGHAVFHAAGAVSADPTHPERLGLLDAILRRADDPLRLTELGEETSFVHASARAYALALLGHWLDALTLVSQVVQVRPDVAYLAWSVRWMQTPGVAATLAPPEAIFPNVFAPLLRGLPVRLAPEDPARPNVKHARALAAMLRDSHPRIPGLYYAGSAMSRRLALYDEAIQLAARARALEPSYMTAIGHACALRDAGQVDAAVLAYKEAIPFDPDDVAVWLDIGDLYVKATRWAEALGAYEEALRKDPRHAWAYPSALYVRARLGEEGAKAALARHAFEHPENDRAQALASELDPPKPFENVLPPPGDATYGALSQVLAMLAEHPERAAGGKVSLRVTHPESPSVLLAFRLATRHFEAPPEVTVEIERVPLPDPREPRAPVPFVLWRWEGTTAHPAVDPPDPRVLRALERMSEGPFRIDCAEESARAVAAELAEPGWAPHLAAAMVHVDRVPEGADPFAWVQRMQISAALALAYLDRSLLFAVARGPVDWVVGAAVVALGRAARADAGVRREVEVLYDELRRGIPSSGCVAYEQALASAWLGLGGHAPRVRADLEAWLERASRATPHDDEPRTRRVI